MKFGIISDSHDNIANVRKAVAVFKERKVDFVLHLGDYVSPPVVREFSGPKLIGIFGNNDGEKFGLVKAFGDIGGELMGDFHEFELDGIKFACLHGTILQLATALVKLGKYDVVFVGHSHEASISQVGKTLMVNPGTAHGFGGRATVAIFDTSTRTAEIIELLS